MSRALKLLLPLVALGAIGGCGSSDEASDRAAKDDVAANVEEIGRQLEENAESLPDDAPSAEPVKRRSVEQVVRDYQALGFFEGEDAATVAAAAERGHRQYSDEPLVIKTRYDELDLLRRDKDRVWFRDIERDVFEGNEMYVAVLQEWARISRGAFAPRKVKEAWGGEKDPVAVSFDLAGKRQTVQSMPLVDFFDLCVLDGVNPLIAGTGKQFAVYGPDADLGQEVFVTVLTAGERRKLEAFGFTFQSGDELRTAFGYGQTTESGEPAPCG